MCTHEGSTQPKLPTSLTTAWDLVEESESAMPHIYRLDGLIVCLRMAIGHLAEELSGPELCHLAAVCIIAEEELHFACEKLETVLKVINIQN